MKRGECAVTAASDTSDLDIDITRRMLRRGQARALVVGTERATGAVLRALRADFSAPVFNVRAGSPLTLPETPATLLIHDVSALDTADQDRLHRWFHLTPPGISVIAVTSEPLFPLVERGAFLADLFYRLNLIVIDVTGVEAGD
jgi:glutamate racemase